MQARFVGLVGAVFMLASFAGILMVYRKTGKSRQSLPLNSACPTEHYINYEAFLDSVTVVYDFSTVEPDELLEELDTIWKGMNQDLISSFIIINNFCQNVKSAQVATSFAEKISKAKLIVIDSNGEKVSPGRARIEAMKHATGQFTLFLSSGSLPSTHNFLESMMSELVSHPDTVFVPGRNVASHNVPHLTWNLNILPAEGSLNKYDQIMLPLLDSKAFMLKSDLYQAIGGYDSFFFKDDMADSIALSLAIWLCGASIVQSQCAIVTGSNQMADDSVAAIKHLQYAKYIQLVYGGSSSHSVTYPGLPFYECSSYDLQAIEARKEFLETRKCLSMSWYAQKFPAYLKLKKHSMLYNPDYHSELPVYKKPDKNAGRWFVLFAGHCIKIDNDQALGMAWCSSIKSQDKFSWLPNGQLKVGVRCVTVRLEDAVLIADGCREGDKSQLFAYNKTSWQMLSKETGHCVTHVNGPNGRQLLSLMPCADNAPFNLFIFGDNY